MADVYYNGAFIGNVRNPNKFIEDIRKKRRSGLLTDELNAVYYSELNEIRINTDSGRLRRPLIIVENGKPILTAEQIEKFGNGELKLKDLINKSCIEYIDAEEEENALIALTENDLTKDHTHLEISPDIILGVSASLIPFAEHNRGDRVNYGAKMAGQSIGVYALNFLIRADTKSNILTYPQFPLVETNTSDIVGLEKHPGGQNIVIAVMPYVGYNMEDAVVINKSSVDRGLFRSTYFRVYETEENRYWGGQEDEICVPNPSIKGYRSEQEYAKLGEDGVIKLETQVDANDVLVGKVSPLRFLGTAEDFMTNIENRRDSSLTVRHGERGTVDKIFMTLSSDGNKLIKVSVREQRIPEIGDKVSSRHGQKGVIGLIENYEDMPFTESGVVPDLLFNPHSVPSRMTMGQLLEILAGKLAALDGQKINATAFGDIEEVDIRKQLEALGFRNDGKEVMYNGKTGEKYEALIFTGVIYYQKLDHMVANKIHSRSKGPVALLTKQPTEGRAKQGGLRLGEMEKDCIIAHGAAMVLKERFDSDRTTLPVCENCGLFAFYDKTKGKLICPNCGESKISMVETVYAFKLMLDELKSLGIYPKVVIGDIHEK